MVNRANSFAGRTSYEHSRNVYMSCVLFFLSTTFLITHELHSQTAATTFHDKDLKTDGFQYPNDFHELAAGDSFIRQQTNGPLSLETQILFDGYVTAYGLSCSQYLPKDKVEWVITSCSEKQRTESGEYECVKQEDTHTHIYVDKNILELKHQLAAQALASHSAPGAADAYDMKMYRYRIQTEIASTDTHFREVMATLWADSFRLVAQNGCLSPQLRRYQDNLTRYTSGQQLLTPSVPMEIPSAHPSDNSLPIVSALPKVTIDYGQIDYISLVNAITSHPYWKYQDKYLRNISPRDYHAQVVSSDKDGTPLEVSVLTAMSNGRQSGFYIFFHEGRPRSIDLQSNGEYARGLPDDIVEDFVRGKFVQR